MSCCAHSAAIERVSILYAALRGDVRRDGRAGDLARERGDIDDLASAPARDHALRRLAADLECAGEVDLDNTAPFVGLEIHHGLAKLNAGVVDEDVDLDACRIKMFERRDDRILVGDIEGARFDPLPVIRKRLGRIRQLLLVAAVEMSLAPAAERPCAIASPSPSEDPVTSAVLPLRSNKLDSSCHPLAASHQAARSIRTGV